jgi:hypothetical protein
MAKFPEVSEVGFKSPIGQSIRFKTLVSTFDELGEEKRRQKWLYPKRDIRLQYEWISKASAETLWEFYLARKGAYEGFNFFLPEPKAEYPSYTGEYVGTGDGSTEVFYLPCKTSSSRTVYVAGTSQAEGSDYDFTAGGGADGADKIDFSSSGMVTPSAGERITIDFTGILKVHCRFAEDYQDFDTFWDRLVTMGILLKGLLNE